MEEYKYKDKILIKELDSSATGTCNKCALWNEICDSKYFEILGGTLPDCINEMFHFIEKPND